MKQHHALRLPLTVSAIYGLVVGVIQLFPALAEVVFGRLVVDPAVESLYGTALIGFGAVVLAAARQPVSRSLGLAVAGALLLSSVDLIVFWALGQLDTATALIPTVINLALAAWVGSAAIGKDEGTLQSGPGRPAH